jgi:hypothetical protein
MQIVEPFFSAVTLRSQGLRARFFGKLNTHNDPDIMRHA